jgi:hypothetical protein
MPLIPESFEGLTVPEQFIFLRALISEAPVERFSELLLHFELFFLDADTQTPEAIEAYLGVFHDLLRRIGLEGLTLDGAAAEALRRTAFPAMKAATPYATLQDTGRAYREHPEYWAL